MKTTPLFAWLLFLGLWPASATAPNIIIVVTDDQGWGDVGYHTPAGQVPIQTPNMDSFATTGIRLERFYATTVCSVTRSCLMTGRSSIRTSVNNTRGLDLSEHIMPQTFKSAGYQAYMVGKWHLGGSDKNLSYTTVNGQSVRIIQEGLEYAPYNRGWDSHYGQYSGAIDYFTHNSAESDNPDRPDWWLNGVQQDGPSEHTDSQGHGGWSPDLLADKAISHIQNRDPSKPFLLYVAFNSIHGPISAPPELITKYQNLGVTNTGRRLVCAAVDGMDQALGRILATLDSEGIANNTLVIWFGDNGGDLDKGSLNSPLRGDKGDSYDGGLHEVAGIRWPGVLPAGVISNQYMWVGDVFPTICAATGVTPQNTRPMDGVNLWPALLAANNNTTTTTRGTTLVTDTSNPIAINQFTDPVNGGTKDFKLIRNHVGNTFPVELYNLTDDPYETTDLLLGANATAYTAIAGNLTTAITDIATYNYPPYIGPPLITNTVAQGGNITLYAPFTSYKTPTTVQWRKNGANIANATTFTQVTDTLGANVNGAYITKYTLSNVTASDAGTYVVVVTNPGGNTTSTAGNLSVTLGAPSLPTPPEYTQGTGLTLSWPAVATATAYHVQVSTFDDFATVIETQTTSIPSATFSGLTSGLAYYYRANATDGTSTSDFSNNVSSTQDANEPVVAITSPANNSTTGGSSILVQGTAVDTVSGVASVLVNGISATTSDNFTNWSATVPLSPGNNTITAIATDHAQPAGNNATASITVSCVPSNPSISSVWLEPTSPTYLDPTRVLAQVAAPPGATLSQVALYFDLGTPVSTKIFQEVFANNSSNNWDGTGAMNNWTKTGGNFVRQSTGSSNRTPPITLTPCLTTNGSSTITGPATSSLFKGMTLTGPNVPAGTKIASITGDTTFVMSANASADGNVTLTAAGATLANCTTFANVTVTCDSTIGLLTGMGLIGNGISSNATVASIPSATTFNMTAAPTTPSSPATITITASGAAAEFQGGNASLDATSITANATVDTTGTAGYVEFYVQTRDLAATNNNRWTFDISPDGGSTWNTRLSESWDNSTVNLNNCVLNPSGTSGGNKTVTCNSTAGLAVGQAISGPVVYFNGTTASGSAVVTNATTADLKTGMFLRGTGIANNTRILTVDSSTQFTMTANATSTGASTAMSGSYLSSSSTVATINANGTAFTLNTFAYVNTAAAPISANSTTINHDFTRKSDGASQPYHYDLAPGELTANMKVRFRFAGYTPTSPTSSPRVDIDDIAIFKTSAATVLSLAMYDDGLHGDYNAGDGVYGAAIPVQSAGTTVGFNVTATDSNNSSISSTDYAYTVGSNLTDATITDAEFLGIPTDHSVALNIVSSVNLEAFVEYGTTSGVYTNATDVTSFPTADGPFEIQLTGLQADTPYYYRLRYRPVGETAFAVRGERSFHTARPRGTPFVFTITADPHYDEVTNTDLFSRTMSNIRADQPDIHIDLGDIFMTDKLSGYSTELGGGLPSQSRVNNRAIMLRRLFEQICHSVPFFFTLGNHEAEYGYLFNAATDKQNNIPAWDLKARKAYFPTPVPDNSFYTGNPDPKDYPAANGNPAGTLGLLEDYYAWEWGDALFIVLDPFWNTLANANTANDAWKWSLGKTQYDWLKTTLENSSARYKFVFMHHIIGGSTVAADGSKNLAARGGVEVADKYEWGGNNSDGSPGFADNRPGWAMPIHQLLVANNVNAVFHGHDHLYVYQTLDGIAYLECPQPGTPNFTGLGSSADGQYTTGVLLPNSGHIRVTVTPEIATAEYVRAFRSTDENASRHNGDIAHSFTLSPHSYPPIEMSAKTTAANTIRWNAVPNTPSYIQWSPDLVSWTTIDTVTTTDTHTNAIYPDTDASRVNRTRGFYRVSDTP